MRLLYPPRTERRQHRCRRCGGIRRYRSTPSGLVLPLRSLPLLAMAGNKIQVGSDGKIRVKDSGIVVAGDSDPCCCGIPTGACCALDGSCTDSNEADCVAAGGIYHGDGTSCASVSCASCTHCTGAQGPASATSIGNCSPFSPILEYVIFFGTPTACAWLWRHDKGGSYVDELIISFCPATGLFYAVASFSAPGKGGLFGKNSPGDNPCATNFYAQIPGDRMGCGAGLLHGMFTLTGPIADSCLGDSVTFTL